MGTEWSEGEVTLSREILSGVETRQEVRAPIGALKRGNARGAKGCRKVDSVWPCLRTTPHRQWRVRLGKMETSGPVGLGGTVGVD